MTDFLKRLTGYDAKLQSFQVNQGFIVDIVCYSHKVEAYLTHKDYGVKELMFSTGFSGQNEELIEFGCMAIRNAPNYFSGYRESYMDKGGE